MALQFTYEELGELVNQHIPDPSVAEGTLFNYYKLLQHAVSYYALKDERKRLKSTLFDKHLTLGLRYRLRQIVRRPSRVHCNDILVLDDMRPVTTDTGTQSYYLQWIPNHLDAEEYTVLSDSFNQSGLPIDIDFDALIALGDFALGQHERALLKDLKIVFARLKKSHLERELLDYIASSFTVFFEEFHRYAVLFGGNDVKKVVMTTHYHHEGLIAAAKVFGAEVIEVQHGLIGRHDLYYVYDARIKPYATKMLFPDAICVFGAYWKEMLLEGSEFDAKQIHVVGDYSQRNVSLQQYRGLPKEDAVLIAAQKNLPHEYIAYAKSVLRYMREKHPEWQLWIKLHPLEKEPHLYHELENQGNCRVFGKSDDIMELLAKCRIQVSIYSTTLYDALGLNVINLAIQNYGSCEDYAKAMVDEGVALPVDFDEDPIEKAASAKLSAVVSANDVYAAPNYSALLELIKTTRA